MTRTYSVVLRTSTSRSSLISWTTFGSMWSVAECPTFFHSTLLKDKTEEFVLVSAADSTETKGEDDKVEAVEEEEEDE